MKKKSIISIDVTTPHDVLNHIISARLPNRTMLSKPESYFSDKCRKEGRARAHIGQIMHMFQCFLDIFRKPCAEFVFREYDGFSLFYILIPFKVSLMFNVNHNLKNAVGRMLTRILSLRFQIIFIDPGYETLRRFKYIIPVYTFGLFEPHESSKWDRKSILLICGSKKDQANYSKGDLEQLNSALSSLGYEVTAVGTNHPDGKFLSWDNYLRCSSRSLVICTSAYKQFRNSGTLWFIKQNSPMILVNASDCGFEQLKGHPCVHEFQDLSEIIDIVDKIKLGIMFKTTEKSGGTETCAE